MFGESIAQHVHRKHRHKSAAFPHQKEGMVVLGVLGRVVCLIGFRGDSREQGALPELFMAEAGEGQGLFREKRLNFR